MRVCIIDVCARVWLRVTSFEISLLSRKAVNSLDFFASFFFFSLISVVLVFVLSPSLFFFLTYSIRLNPPKLLLFLNIPPVFFFWFIIPLSNFETKFGSPPGCFRKLVKIISKKKSSSQSFSNFSLFLSLSPRTLPIQNKVNSGKICLSTSVCPSCCRSRPKSQHDVTANNTTKGKKMDFTPSQQASKEAKKKRNNF